MGGDTVVIDKMFGPLIFADLRVTADTARGCWVIERQWVATDEWVEWTTIPAQLDAEFREADKHNL